ncbi:hypothetical protein E2562_007417 [Oryza meyeriana var. granulata]|uniref:Retrotransposon gag domain-containing protein n=1 Tax=Oryza meyeriana var. granulata TaxID=110450 RepID=A0A6G1D0D7_9ORYZ|nr:hypothetical protein E2562_007417 [Oryza meyeriana var. granulata]
MTQNLNQGQSKLADFQRTHPSNFSSTTDPLDADDWLRDSKAKFNLARCDEREKAAYAAYYLQGAAIAWWESYKTLIPADKPIIWAVFKEGFRSTHISDGLMELKRKEFLNLKQGYMPFMDFLNRFNYLARYAPEEMTTEARKVKLCRDRLNPEMEYALSAHEINSMKSLVDKALRVESSGKKVMEERKQKWVAKKDTMFLIVLIQRSKHPNLSNKLPKLHHVLPSRVKEFSVGALDNRRGYTVEPPVVVDAVLCIEALAEFLELEVQGNDTQPSASHGDGRDRQ